jgi:hypothetical protein
MRDQQSTLYNPFAEHAHEYLEKGWHPFPLWTWEKGVPDDRRAKGKSSPPKGYTGRSGANATHQEIDAWISEGRFFNIGTRMPDNVIVIDVDAYKNGDAELERLEAKYGPLPPTWTATARTDGSKHRYYRVNGRKIWANPGEGIDIIHWGWRYTVLPPSVHPGTGTPYNWFEPDGHLSWGRRYSGAGITRPENLTELPAAWVTLLDTGQDPSIIAAKADMNLSQVGSVLDVWLSEGEPCHHMRRVLDKLDAIPAGGRHDACMRAQMALVRYSEGGHPGGQNAIEELQDWFMTAVDDRNPESEWRRGLVNAVQRIAADPSHNVFGCLPKVDTSMKSFTTTTRSVRS